MHFRFRCYRTPDRATAEAAIATFAKKYGAKYEKAVTCLAKEGRKAHPRKSAR